MGEEKEILLRGNLCAYLTDRLMGDPEVPFIDPADGLHIVGDRP